VSKFQHHTKLCSQCNILLLCYYCNLILYYVMLLWNLKVPQKIYSKVDVSFLKTAQNQSRAKRPI
jgi:hypothetical protein